MQQQRPTQPVNANRHLKQMLVGAAILSVGAIFSAWVSSGGHRLWIVDRHRANHPYGE
ncbi:hypothetical protein [Burkholderia sp. Ac-20353]|uniref:hypothetical protein n=1 Tax=Burkholderia sp. Ac-20353 TaxID=2703894 RepID=UPI00197C960E|nr:hypothetical protein [Burkholderia sp. Ac-20353]MBN3786036.1 hypothetical protein [Burkholderia sp. Ac-20353]